MKFLHFDQKYHTYRERITSDNDSFIFHDTKIYHNKKNVLSEITCIFIFINISSDLLVNLQDLSSKLCLLLHSVIKAKIINIKKSVYKFLSTGTNNS